jgi:hypothetical protein
MRADVGMVWIDVYGSEIDVLAGMPKLIQAGVPLVVELSAERFQYDMNELFRLLASSSYSCFIDLRSTSTVSRPLKGVRDLPQRWANLLFL